MANLYIEDNVANAKFGRALKTRLVVASLARTATAAAATATPPAVQMYSSGIGIYAGSGTPNAVVSAPKGSLYIRTDGSTTNDRLYVNTNGTTGWTNVTTAA